MAIGWLPQFLLFGENALESIVGIITPTPAAMPIMLPLAPLATTARLNALAIPNFKEVSRSNLTLPYQNAGPVSFDTSSGGVIDAM